MIAQFNPVNLGDLKKQRDYDLYILQSIKGKLNRLHLVARNGVAEINPPPEDSLCESCHKKEWLQKDFRTSKVDGANAPVWLCPDCFKVDVGAQLRGLDDIEAGRPKTRFALLDDNPRLMALMFEALQQGVTGTRKNELMPPFVVIETLAGRRMLQSFKSDRLEMGFEEARAAILAAPTEAIRYAFCCLGYSTVEGVRYETVLVKGGERGDNQAAAVGQRYKQHLPEIKCEPIGNATIFGPCENYLTLARDPAALAKLPPTLIRLTVDMAHNHGPGHDEALKYEIRKTPVIHLNLGDLDRPFRKELQKEPDMVNVTIRGRKWMTMFGPKDKEVVLARIHSLPWRRIPDRFSASTKTRLSR